MERDLEKLEVLNLLSRLRAQRTTTESVRFEVSTEQLTQLILGACEIEVNSRGRKFKATDALKSQVRVVAEVLNGTRKRHGILLCGVCGTGKTTLVNALAMLFPNLPTNRADGKRVGLVQFKATEMKNPEELEKAKQYPMISVDDFGRETLRVVDYGNTSIPIIELIEHRYDKQLFTIFTTNFTPKQVRERYGDRVADRFNEMVEFVVFQGESFRN